MKTNLMQLLRLVLMVLAVAGVIYAIEFMERGIAVWFWVALLGIGFVGLLYTFRLTQRRVARETRERQRLVRNADRGCNRGDVGRFAGSGCVTRPESFSGVRRSRAALSSGTARPVVWTLTPARSVAPTPPPMP